MEHPMGIKFTIKLVYKIVTRKIVTKKKLMIKENYQKEKNYF